MVWFVLELLLISMLILFSFGIFIMIIDICSGSFSVGDDSSFCVCEGSVLFDGLIELLSLGELLSSSELLSKLLTEF